MTDLWINLFISSLINEVQFNFVYFVSKKRQKDGGFSMFYCSQSIDLNQSPNPGNAVWPFINRFCNNCARYRDCTSLWHQRAKCNVVYIELIQSAPCYIIYLQSKSDNYSRTRRLKICKAVGLLIKLKNLFWWFVNKKSHPDLFSFLTYTGIPFTSPPCFFVFS